jgi:hypothetical protein
MLESQLSQEPATSLTRGGSLRLQRTLATILAIPALFFLLAGLVMAADIICGEFKMLLPLLAVTAITYSVGALSLSLFRGRGVPAWFLRAFWMTITTGSVYLTTSELWKFFKGEQVDLVVCLLVCGMTIYFSISTFKSFWTSRDR